jgi:hypothetical protein
MPTFIVGKKSLLHGGTILHEGDEIELTEELAERHGLEPKTKKTTPPPEKKLSAEEAIAAIAKCETLDQVKAFFAGEDRVTVKDAAKAKIKELAAALKAAEKK